VCGIELDWLVIGVSPVVYAGMALAVGRLGDRPDGERHWAIVLFVSGAVDGDAAFRFIDFRHCVLLPLCVIAAQFAHGFFEWISTHCTRPSQSRILQLHIVLTGRLAAFLTMTWSYGDDTCFLVQDWFAGPASWSLCDCLGVCGKCGVGGHGDRQPQNF
jgi:hypothetical protein